MPEICISEYVQKNAESNERLAPYTAAMAEVARTFEGVTFVDLFAEISELSQLHSNRGLVKLYERFLLTRSERVADLLKARGVALFAGPPKAKN